MKPILISPRLTLIPLDSHITGVPFIGAWLYRNGATLLVDPGPSAMSGTLLRALSEMGVRTLDAVLLTHIHIDHAGGMAELLDRFPETAVVCHEKARGHLADPALLWEGSLKTLGRTARMYGPIRPVAESSMVAASAAGRYGVTALPTPGHAPHHVSYLIDGDLFVGEACGVFYPPHEDVDYLRPATPPRFFLETTLASLERLMDTSHHRLCYGHFGSSQNTPGLLADHRRQLLFWREGIDREKKADSGHGLIDRCLARLLEEDPMLRGFKRMAPDVQERERSFLANSIRGFLGYLESLEAGLPS